MCLSNPYEQVGCYANRRVVCPGHRCTLLSPSFRRVDWRGTSAFRCPGCAPRPLHPSCPCGCVGHQGTMGTRVSVAGAGSSGRHEWGALRQRRLGPRISFPSRAVHVGLPQVFKEYWNKPEQTRKEFTEDGYV